jgi:outer membrane lipoprotein-sorting protein
MKPAHFRFGLMLITTFALVGCRPKPPTPLPSHPWVDDATAIRTIAERSRAIKTVQGTCALILTKPDGQRVALDGILVVAAPDRLRLEARKLGHKIFDLTLNPDGLFVLVDDPSRKGQVMPASLSAARFVREWALFNGGFFELPVLKTRHDGDKLIVTGVLPDGRRVECQVDQPTLTPRLYQLFDPSGVERFTLKIPDYRLIDAVVYPDHMYAKSEQGLIEIQMREIELNTEPTESAFTPSPKAEKQPM